MIPTSVNGTVHILGHVYPTYRLMFIVVASVLALIGTYVLGRTRAGALLRAAADDRDMVGAMGYAPWRVHAGAVRRRRGAGRAGRRAWARRSSAPGRTPPTRS